ncbi:MAG: hypothetical protein WA885_14490 [Phormidesmis sp.]
MSVQIALEFVQRLRTDEALKSRFTCPIEEIGIERLVELGADIGLIFTGDEIVAAHKHDWGMRWLHHDRQLHR